jgi:hypothetical protein
MTKWTMTEQQFVEIMQANYYSEAGLKIRRRFPFHF